MRQFPPHGTAVDDQAVPGPHHPAPSHTAWPKPTEVPPLDKRVGTGLADCCHTLPCRLPFGR